MTEQLAISNVLKELVEQLMSVKAGLVPRVSVVKEHDRQSTLTRAALEVKFRVPNALYEHVRFFRAVLALRFREVNPHELQFKEVKAVFWLKSKPAVRLLDAHVSIVKLVKFSIPFMFAIDLLLHSIAVTLDIMSLVSVPPSAILVKVEI
jgi:hypothetical protein